MRVRLHFTDDVITVLRPPSELIPGLFHGGIWQLRGQHAINTKAISWDL